MPIRSFKSRFAALALTLGAAAVPALAEVEVALQGDGERAIVKQVTAEIVAIDPETRDITLEGPLGNTITLTAGPEVERFDEFAKGDNVQATYSESISSELRAPTEEELAEPWVELDAAGVAAANMPPAAGVGLIVRAVCTIEGMNRVTGTVTLQDPRGHYHIVPDVPAAKMEGIKLGDTVVITYSEAIALTLEKQGS
ncbi:MAG: hypothetical protein KDI05_15165 [Halieaceae bacterium]|nr:hypothetical protein [Halieaceae bacterium]MCP5164112.1 hypothetical protein [Pseudomonadales bacterium]MCP5203812.1 hypothetical protein [Pseudomonadales bacterium]